MTQDEGERERLRAEQDIKARIRQLELDLRAQILDAWHEQGRVLEDPDTPGLRYIVRLKKAIPRAKELRKAGKSDGEIIATVRAEYRGALQRLPPA